MGKVSSLRVVNDLFVVEEDSQSSLGRPKGPVSQRHWENLLRADHKRFGSEVPLRRGSLAGVCGRATAARIVSLLCPSAPIPTGPLGHQEPTSRG